MYLLDTNILIYYLRGDEKLVEYLEDLSQQCFCISIISRLELLLGHSKEKKSINELECILDDCKNISLDQKIVKEAVNLHYILKRKLKFKDLVIAATAKVNNCTLLTADKDFGQIKGLKVDFYWRGNV